MKRTWFVGLLAAAALVSAASAWGAPGQIVFASNRADGARDLYVVNGDGTGEHRLTLDGNGVLERAPVWSPDGTTIAFAGMAPDGNWDIYTVGADGKNFRRLTSDPERDDNPQWTSDGRIVWQHGPFGCPCQAWIMNADGSEQSRIPIAGDVVTPAPSPNGQKLAYATDSGGFFSLHVAQLNGKGDKRITGDAGMNDFQPRWSPTGNDLAFLRYAGSDGANDLYVVHANGQGLRRLTNTPDVNEFWESWAPDGGSIVYDTAEDGWRVHRVDVASGNVSSVNTSPTAPMLETFDEGARDASLWHQINDPGGTIGEQDGRLVASISGSAVPGGQYNQVDEHWGLQCQLNGDFDMQVDYDLLTWPAHNGYFAALSAFFNGGSVSRQSAEWDPPYDEAYGFWTTNPFTFAQILSTDLSGSLRLVRNGGTLTGYERATGGDWLEIGSGPSSGMTVAGLALQLNGNYVSHEDGSVAFDNFRLNSGSLTCPTWWQDYAPDVSWR